MKQTVTFETQCWENDYDFVLNPEHLKEAIDNCNFEFSQRVVIINKVNDRKKVEQLAKQCQEQHIIDDYYFADDSAEAALTHFGYKPEDFGSGYYYSRGQLIGLYNATTDYVLHFTADSHIKEPNNSTWIKDGILEMENNNRYICVTPRWEKTHEAAKGEAIETFGDWYAGYGFSDNCYLVPTKLFKTDIYGEYNPGSNHYPSYAGECFEKRVDSYMRNHGLLRLINKKADYSHTHLPRKRHLYWSGKIKSYVKKSRHLASRTTTRFKKSPSMMDQRTARIHPIEGMKEYRKKIKVYDIVTFFNELDLLEMRLAILNPHVDYFVIVEATETFSGRPKPLVFKENMKRFEKYKDKIIHLVVTDTPKSRADLKRRLQNKKLSRLDRQIITDTLTSDNVPVGQIHWLKEFFQKESIKKALVGLNDDDMCFVGDVDEIWNPNVVIDYRSDDIFKLRQDVYAYYFNNRSSEPWAGTLVTKYKNIKHACLNHLRTVSKTPYTYVRDGGWHFTHQGGVDQIRKKLESYGHQEYNTHEIKNKLEETILANKDFIGRKFTFIIDEANLPEYIKKNKHKYIHYFRKDSL